MKTVIGFLEREVGQDVIEYTLLLAFLSLVSAGLFINSGSSVNKIWATANQVLDNGAKAASAGGGGGGAGGGGDGDGGGGRGRGGGDGDGRGGGDGDGRGRGGGGGGGGGRGGG